MVWTAPLRDACFHWIPLESLSEGRRWHQTPGSSYVFGHTASLRCAIILQWPKNNILWAIWWDQLAFSPRDDNTQLTMVVPNMGRKARQQHYRHNDILISSGQQVQALLELSNVWGDLQAHCTVSRAWMQLSIWAVRHNMERWLGSNNTYPDIKNLLLQYLCGRRADYACWQMGQNGCIPLESHRRRA
jgi:hypothetical protein